MMNRRSFFAGALRSAGASVLVPILSAATPFWNRKPPSEWKPEEIEQLLTRSPWARETNIDFEESQGGHIELPPGGGASAQEGQGRGHDPAAGVMRRAPVVVRWESAQAVRDALQLPLLRVFDGRYVISVSNIPPEAMASRHGRGEPAPPSKEEMINDLQGAATLEIAGREPAGAGLVRLVPGSQSNYLFGFDRELLPLTGNEKEIEFVLRTARVSVKAKFEVRSMLYRGKLSL